MGAVRDKAVVAANTGEFSTLSAALDVYAELISVALTEMPERSSITRSLSDGREWRQMLRDLYLIAEAVVLTRRFSALLELVELQRTLVRVCVEKGDARGVRSILNLVEATWSDLVDLPARGREAMEDGLLLRVSELRFIGSRYRTDAARDSRLEQELARCFVQLVKTALDQEQTESAEVALRYFNQAFDSGDNDRLVLLHDAGILALEAWALMRSEQQDVYGGRDVLHILRRSLIRPRSLWTVSEFIRSENLTSELGWTWWELPRRGPSSSGYLKFESYLVMATLFSAQRPYGVPRVLGESSAQIARAWIEGIGELRRAELAAIDLNADLDDLEESLKQLVKQFEISRAESEAGIEIDSARVARFKRSTGTALAAARRGSLVEFFQTGELEEGDEGLFGVDTLVPRYYFTESHVQADPDALANEFAVAIVAGEDARILEAVVDPHFESAGDANLDFVAERILPFVEGMLIVTNSMQVAELAQTDLGRSRPDGVVGLNVRRVADGRPPYAAVIQGEVRIRLSAPQPELVTDSILARQPVLVGVSTAAATLLDEHVAQLGLEGLVAAEYRSRVRVRVLERFDVDIDENVAVGVWLLPEDTW